MKQNVLWFLITLRMNKYFSPHSDIKVLLGRLSKSKQAERGFSSSSANSSPQASFRFFFSSFFSKEKYFALCLSFQSSCETLLVVLVPFKPYKFLINNYSKKLSRLMITCHVEPTAGMWHKKCNSINEHILGPTYLYKALYRKMLWIVLFSSN